MKVGFIGLGIMGKPMAKNLLKAGYQVCVNDFHKEAVEELVAAGATAGANNAEVAKGVDVVITMVPNSRRSTLYFKKKALKCWTPRFPAESQRQLMEPYLSCVVVRKRYLTSTLTY